MRLLNRKHESVDKIKPGETYYLEHDGELLMTANMTKEFLNVDDDVRALRDIMKGE